MRRLAVEGGAPLVTQPIPPLNVITREVTAAVNQFMRTVELGQAQLSGYLAGSERGGSAVQRLEEIWCTEFGSKYAIACNSATSGLLAACAVRGKNCLVPTMGMSAIAAAPSVLTFDIEFADIDEHFCLPNDLDTPINTVIAVNLFGHPAPLHDLCKTYFVIEDNAQAPWATENGAYTGTIGQIGVWSANVHKPINGGEGGIITTNDSALAERLRAFINHGEVTGREVGLNLRMPELTAVIILAQMPYAPQVVRRRREIWSAFSEAGNGALVMPQERAHCISSWYCHPILAPDEKARDRAVKMLMAEGVPCRAGYTLIHKLPVFASTVDGQTFPVADSLDSRMVLLELASIDPSDDQIEMMTEALDAVGRHL